VSADRVRRQYARLAERYDLRWARYNTASVRETLRRSPLRSIQRVLDVGCGTGTLMQEIHNATRDVWSVGVDVALPMLQVAARKLGSGNLLVAADVQVLPFRPKSFDLVISTSSFHYWSNPIGALREIRRLLRPGGRLVITDWCNDYFQCRVFDRVLRLLEPAHRRAYDREELAVLLTEAGYGIEAIERYKIDWFWGLMTVRAERGRCEGD
jgi:ubiquinone/menaquinone biosynthesis C-methylase UbiE